MKKPAAKPSILERILARRRQRVEEARAQVGLEEMRRRAASQPGTRSLRAALLDPEFPRRSFIIAEVKRASPSAGRIRPDLDAVQMAEVYRDAGAGGISILTEVDFFHGRPEDLVEIRARIDLPLLRKDFIIDEYQVQESRALGADALLLIVAALTPPELQRLLGATRETGMEAIVEVHDGKELDTALRAGARMVGVNNRDLTSFEVNLETSLRLADSIPASVARIAESGIRTRNDVEVLANAGFHGFLIGETLLRSADPGGSLRELIG